MKRRLFCAALCVAAALGGGCRRVPPKPDGLPELYPCRITATFGGEAIEGVRVSLVSELQEARKWRSGGMTDANGSATIKTAFCYDGAPAGTFRLSFAKSRERLGDTLEEMTPLSEIPLKYAPLNSELTVEIKPGKNDLTFALDGGEELFPIPKGAVQPPKGKR